MSTLVFVDPEISTQADGAQSPRVPVPFPEDPYEAIRQAYLVETETPESPHTIASPTPLPDSTPPTRHVEDSVDSDKSGARSTPSDSTIPLSPGHRLPMLHPPWFLFSVAAMSNSAFRKRFRSSYESSPSSSPLDLPSRKCYREEECPTTEDEDPAAGDEGPGIRVESFGLGGNAAIPKGQQRAAPVMETTVGEPLGLGYGALRRREIALGEGRMPSVFEVGQSSGFVPGLERPERVLTLRQPTLTIWIDPEDGITYIDVPAYPPPSPPVQTPPSPEWSSGSLVVSPPPSIVPSPISSPVIPLTVPSPVASPATAETEGSGAVRDKIFSQRYRFRSLEHEKERVAVTFRAIWRPVLALESWEGQTVSHPQTGPGRNTCPRASALPCEGPSIHFHHQHHHHEKINKDGLVNRRKEEEESECRPLYSHDPFLGFRHLFEAARRNHDMIGLAQFYELELDIQEHQFLPHDGCDRLDLLYLFK
ncbi:hypothetical protein Tco_0655635 [Tanacetum coccineum]|uniref:Uncharacterized protein n=1 Tax=Tanacetum coccineum TaxID=301880 RepID=A0ABQ4X6K0_9ASTR